MSTTTLTRTPKRWPVNTEVIDSPACAMPEYATYRRHYWLVSGATALSAAKTLDKVIDSATIWADRHSRIVRVPVIPYYDLEAPDGESGRSRPVGTSRWAGGTMSGRCGSTMWVHDADRHYQSAFRALAGLDDSVTYFQSGTTNYNVSKLQAWWINGIADRHPHLDGFPVECMQERRHIGLCTALDLAWDWRDYSPWTDMGHDTQMSLF